MKIYTLLFQFYSLGLIITKETPTVSIPNSIIATGISVRLTTEYSCSQRHTVKLPLS
jgi:hypothetical protein